MPRTSLWSITTDGAEDIRMTRKRMLQPTNPIHPGEMLLEEVLRPLGKSQTTFAREVGWS